MRVEHGDSGPSNSCTHVQFSTAFTGFLEGIVERSFRIGYAIASSALLSSILLLRSVHTNIPY